MTSKVSPSTDAVASSYPPFTLRLVAACFILSGATGLIYEVLWARMLGLVFGATTLAVSTVLAAFMGGLALGSAIAGRVAGSIKRPVRAYGLLEIGIAVYALAVPFLFSVIDNLYAIIWQQFHPSFFVFSLWRFLLSCVMLLIPTTLMGATLPLLSAALTRSVGPTSTSVTRLYTRNLVGAICGCIAAGFLLLPILGVRGTIYTASFINVIIGIVAMIADRRGAATASDVSAEASATASERLPLETEKASARNAKTDFGETGFWLFCAFASGFVTISTQVAWTRILSMIIGSSTYAFSIVVALFLLGLSAGAFIIARRDLAGRLRVTIVKVELLTAVSLILSLKIVNGIPELLFVTGQKMNISSWAGLLALQIFSVALLVLLPAFLMGTVMPLTLGWAGAHPGEDSVKLVGRSYAVNTVGAIAGAFAAGFLLIPKVSTRFTIIFAAALCVIVAAVAYRPQGEVRDKDVSRGLAAGGAAVVIILMFIFAPKMNLADLSSGAFDSLVRVIAKTRGQATEEASRQGPAIHSLLMYEEGPTSTVSVRKDWDITSMAINGRTNASDREDMPTQVMLGQLPLLLAPNTKNALVVGYATGVTAGSMLQSPIESLECVELEPATVRGSRFFEHVNNKPLNDPRMHLIIDDARTYLRVVPTRYDIIVSEPSHPWVPGVANLFTEEFFELGRDRLADEGVFVQWLQIYQLSTDSLRSVLATFHRVFPHVVVFRVEGATKGKDLLLIGSRRPLPLDVLMDRTRERMGDQRVSAELARVNINSEGDIRSWYVCDESRLAPAVAGAVINTDNNMHIETTVPREAFRPLMQTNAAWIEALAK